MDVMLLSVHGLNQGFISISKFVGQTEIKAVCVLMFYTGSVEDRRYLRHDILNEDVDFNVIVTT